MSIVPLSHTMSVGFVHTSAMRMNMSSKANCVSRMARSPS